MFYDFGASNALKTLGFSKEARFIGKDLAAGVDPTGTFTTSYGVEDADEKGIGALGPGAVGVAGGAIGGGLLVPSTIYGLINAPAGYAKGKLPGVAREFWKGFKRPIQSVVQGGRGLHSMHHAGKKGLTAKEVQRLDSLWRTSKGPEYHKLMNKQIKSQKDRVGFAAEVAAGPEAGAVVGRGAEAASQHAAAQNTQMKNNFKRYMEEGMTAEEFGAIPKAVRGVFAKELASNASTGAKQIGLAGAIGGGSAGLQYTKGRELGSFMTPEKRQEYLDS